MKKPNPKRNGLKINNSPWVRTQNKFTKISIVLFYRKQTNELWCLDRDTVLTHGIESIILSNENSKSQYFRHNIFYNNILPTQ